ncbi:FG-GAP-like repeat-containing protein [Fodinibius halophilus]|uniref:T9SS type A sorting domain-containing protein n=1 Tax=Fodinibius halophilus TaxID=1736908 RepID=A0A6M1TCE9_9BACT|nr:FG-GAP-like repeat-containing protein [Fodinibius halophilus]NGP89671.1 T9SS type A sorting domain-containing protein [Fodinibius halophilus]
MNSKVRKVTFLTVLLGLACLQPAIGQTLFSPQQIISTNVDSAESVHAADLDGDGFQDVISASYSYDEIAWYKNDGTGNFGSKQVITTNAEGGQSVYVADLDGDGDQDVLSASSIDDKIAWYENDGAGNFGSQQIITTSADGAVDVYVADLDGDGAVDVLSASYVDDKIAWYQNDGSGVFGSQQVITTNADGAQKVYAADLDGDGSPDVLSASGIDDKIAWYANDGNGNFDSQQVITTNTDGAWGVFAADLNGDGSQDVLSASQYDNTIAWYKNDGTGTFGPQQVITTNAARVLKVYATDLNGDGSQDVLSASRADDKIAWYKNDGSGSFGSQQVITTNAEAAQSVYTEDLDNDGDEDVLSASYDDDKIAWYENDPPPRNIILGMPEDSTFRRSAAPNDTITVGYSYSEIKPDSMTVIFANQASGDSASYGINDSSYPGDKTLKTTTLDLSSPQSISGNGLQDGTTYDITITATDSSAQTTDTTLTDRLTIDETAPILDNATVKSDSLWLDYNDVLDSTSVPATSSFEVRVNGSVATLGSTEIISDTTVILLSTAVKVQDSVVVDYTAGSAPLRDRALNQAANFSAQSVTNITEDTTPPDVPTALTASATVDSVRLSWTGADSSDISVYHIYREMMQIDSTAGPANYSAIDTVNAPTTTYIDSAVTPGASYYYRIAAVDTASNESGFSNEAETDIPPPGLAEIKPQSGAVGTTVRIYGVGFSTVTTDNEVTFGNVSATVDSASSRVLYVQVPSGISGPTSVSVAVHDTTMTGSETFVGITGGIEIFSNIEAAFTGVDQSSSNWGDYDGDGDLDLVITGYDGSDQIAKIYQNDNGTFTNINAGLSGVNNGSSDWGDYDGDGDLDLLITGRDNNDNRIATIYRNDGNDTFTDIGVGLTGVDVSSSEWGDYDGDGDLDLVITGDTGNNLLTTIYRNDGEGVFTDISAGLTGVRSGSSNWGDYDGDGDLDLVITGYDGSNRIAAIYRNEGNGVFTAIGAGLTVVRRSSLDWGDYDADGDLDLVITGEGNSGTQNSAIYRNDGGGTFTNIGAGLNGVIDGSSNWGDFDGDGDLDLVVTGHDGNTQIAAIYRNDSSTFTNINAGLTGVNNGSSSWGDYDGDGDLDLSITGKDTDANQLAIIYENGDIVPPDVPTALAGSATRDSVSLSWTGSDSSDVSSYRIYRETTAIDSTAGPAAYTALDTVSVPATSYTDSSITTGNTYHYRIAATDTAGNVSGFSNEAQINTPTLRVTAIEPKSGAAGTITRIYGSGFSLTATNNEVKFGESVATVDSAKSSVLYAKVPSNASGLTKISVSVEGSTVTGSETFTAVTGGSELFGAIESGLTAVESSSSAWGDYDGDGDQDLVIAGRDTNSNPTATIYRNDGSGTFTALGTGLTGVFRSSSDWGDYDGDGDLDLVITGIDANSTGNKTAIIYRNDGGGTFAAIGAGLIGVDFGSSDWGDYDGDGDLDLLITGRDNNDNRVATIYRNDGGGIFTDIGAGLTGVDLSSSDWGDYDGDGDLDLVVTGRDVTGNKTAIIYRNDGSGTFTDIGAGLTGVDFGSSNWGDYDGDGDLDLVITGEGDGGTQMSTIYRNDGGGTFTDIGAGLTGVDGSSSDWGDFDGDGDLDLVVIGSASGGEIATIYRNDGRGMFSALGAGLTGVASSSSAWADYDGDGDLDLVVTGDDENSNNSATIYENGDIVPPDVPTALAGSATRDGVSLSWIASDSSDVSAYHIYRESSGIDSTAGPSNFTALDTVDVLDTSYIDSTIAAATTYHYRITAVDTAGNVSGFSNEAQVTTPSLRLTTHEPKSGAEGTSVRIYGSSFNTTAVGNVVKFGQATATVDSAKRSVLYTKVPNGIYGPVELSVAANDTIVVGTERFIGIRGGSSSFETIGAGLTGVNGSSSAWGDFDGDGNLDLVVTGDDVNGNPTAAIYRNDGNGTFTDIGAGLTDVDFSSSDWGDYDGDGKLDLVVIGRNVNGNPTAIIYRNDGNGTFTDIGAGLTGVDFSSSDWGDYDGDGDLDLVVTGRDVNGNPTTMIYRNDGGGTFSTIGAGLAGVEDGSSDWGDYDGDGDLDLVVTGQDDNFNSTAMIYRNDGGGTFSFVGAGLTGVEGGSSAWGDYDGDGDLDLVVTGRDVNGNPTTMIYRNDGGGTFSTIGAGLAGVEGGSSDWGDYDGDGDLDLVVTGQDVNGNPTTMIYRNDGGGTFSAIGAGLAGVEDGSSDWGDYDGDGDLDLVVTGVDGSGNETAAIYQNGGGDITPPDVPTALAASPTPDSVNISWTASDSADVASYHIYRETTAIDSTAGPGNYAIFDTVEVSSTTYTDTTVTENGTYYYRISAADTAGNESDFSNEVEVLATDVTPPSPPINIMSKAGVDSINVSWVEVNAADLLQYKVYRDTSPIDSVSGLSAHTPVDSVRQDTHFVDTNIESGKTYYFRITAVDSSSNESGFSRQTSVWVPTAPTLQLEEFGPDSLVSYQYNRKIFFKFSHLLDTASIGNGNGAIRLNGSLSGEDIPFDYNLTSDGTGFKIEPDSSFYGTETLTVEIHTGPDGIKSTTGKEFDGNQNEKVEASSIDDFSFTFEMSIPGDFDANSEVNFDDLTKLRSVWNNDYAKELGPVTGTFPALRVQPDSTFDGFDLVTFIRYWNYTLSNDSGSSNGVSAKADSGKSVGKPGKFVNKKDVIEQDNSSPSSSKEDVDNVLTKRKDRMKSATQNEFSYINISTSTYGDEYQDARSSAKSSQMVEYDLLVDYPDNLLGIELVVEYDPSNFSLKHIESRQLFDDVENGKTVFVSHIDSSKGLAVINVANFGQLQEGHQDDSLATLRFEVRRSNTDDIQFGYDIRNKNNKSEVAWSGISEGTKMDLPQEIVLEDNYPNPFNPQTTIQYQIPEQSTVQVKIYDVLGRRVATLIDKDISPGSYRLRFNAEQHLASGVYFYVLDGKTLTDGRKFRKVKKMLLLK